MDMLLTVTDAGRAALVNAQNTGTAPVLMAKIGVTATTFVPTAALAAVPAELKRMDVTGGTIVAADVIHVLLQDNSADTYSLKGFGLYLASGILFGSYSQAGVITTKAAGATLLLAVDIRLAAIDATAITFGDTNFIDPPASEDSPGVIEIATVAEAAAGADKVRAITPFSLAGLLKLLAPLKSPAFTDMPTAPTPDAADNSKKLSTTAFVAGAIATVVQQINTAVASINQALATKAPLASPDLTGTPTAPTPAANDNSKKLATTQYVVGAIAALFQIVADALATKAPIASPTFTGTPKAPTQAPGDSTEALATTAFVKGSGDALRPGIAKAWATFTGNGQIMAGQNISNVTRQGDGRFVVTFAAPMDTAEYAVVATARMRHVSIGLDDTAGAGVQTRNSFTLWCQQSNANIGDSPQNPARIFVAIYA